ITFEPSLAPGLLVVKQYPAERRQPDDHGNRNRPDADTDGTGGLPRAFIGRDLAIAFLAFPGRIGHGVTPQRGCVRKPTLRTGPRHRLQRRRGSANPPTASA